MTSLRDLFKKSKKTAKETTDKILDADIEENVSKVGEATASGIPYIGKALKLIFFVFLPIAIAILVASSLYQKYVSSPKYCNELYYMTFENEYVYDKLQLMEFTNLKGQFMGSHHKCWMSIKVDGEYYKKGDVNYLLSYLEMIEDVVYENHKIGKNLD